MLSEPSFGDRHVVLVLGGLMVRVGLAFKLSAVPFHFWCPDVFEGASAKSTRSCRSPQRPPPLALLIRVAVGFGHLPAAETTAAVTPTGARVVDRGVSARSATAEPAATALAGKAADVDSSAAPKFMAGPRRR